MHINVNYWQLQPNEVLNKLYNSMKLLQILQLYNCYNTVNDKMTCSKSTAEAETDQWVQALKFKKNLKKYC